jgi:hypothetical protein
MARGELIGLVREGDVPRDRCSNNLLLEGDVRSAQAGNEAARVRDLASRSRVFEGV